MRRSLRLSIGKICAVLVTHSLLLLAIGCTNTSAHSDSPALAGAPVLRNPASADQKTIDDNCFVAYSHEAGACNDRAASNDAAFASCLAPAKGALLACCTNNGGSPNCAADATEAADTVKKAIDDKCFVAYSQGASRCNQASSNNDAVFGACLAPVKRQLKSCCQQNGGSPTCSADAAPGATSDTAALNKIIQERKVCLASAEGQSQAGAENCEAVSGKDLERELNAIYQAAIKIMDNKTAAEFKAAELAWLNYRAKQTNFVGHTFAGGSGAGLAMSSASNNMTIARIKQILSQ